MINIRCITAQYMDQNFSITAEVTETMFDVGLIREDVAKRVLIRNEYSQRERTHKKTELKIHLAEKFSTSLSTIEKILAEGITKFP